jgi:hypothetical protein
MWHIVVRLIKTADGKMPAKRKINWVDGDTVFPITKAMLDGKVGSVPANVMAQWWTVQGIAKTGPEEVDGQNHYKATKSIPSYVLKGKNLKKINETTVLTQALIQTRSKYLKKVNDSAVRENAVRFFPVAVHKYDMKPRDKSRHIVYPVAVQRKLDGGRTLSRYDSKTNKVELYSRKLKDVSGHEHVEKALNKIYKIINKKEPNAYLDGELYKHGLSLQKISGLMRREKGSKTAAREAKLAAESKIAVKPVLLEFHVFDIFFPISESEEMRKMNYLERMIFLGDIFKKIKKTDPALLTYVKKVETYIVDDIDAEEAMYKKFLTEDYEGSIVRNLHAPYEYGTNKEIRSYQMRKRKPRHSAEYEVVNYTQGTQGKDRGAIIWVLKTKRGILFNSTPVGADYEERYAAFAMMTPKIFDKEYKGRQMTVEYDDISDNGVPLRAKTKGVRVID